MKRVLTIIALVLVFSTSVIAGTLAMYTTTIDNLAKGSVVAKEFILLKGGTDTFTENLEKIAPSETVDWQFSVKNYNGDVISETAMDLNFAVDLIGESGKTLIAPLKVTVKNSDGDIIDAEILDGNLKFTDEFELSASGQEKIYTVSVNWPSDDNSDIDYAGVNHGTAVKVSVTGTQK